MDFLQKSLISFFQKQCKSQKIEKFRKGTD